MGKNGTDKTSAPRRNAGNKGGFRKHLIRALSIVLTAALLSGMLVFEKTDVKSSGDMEQKLGSAVVLKLLSESEYISADRLTRMLMYARYVLGTNDSYEDFVLGADICIAGGDFAAAAELTLGAIRTAENDGALAEQYFRAGYLYALTENNDEALGYLTLGTELSEDAEALSVKALLHMNRGEEEKAKEAITRYARLCTPSNADMTAGKTALRAGAYEAAETIFTHLSESGMSDAFMYRGVGRSAQGKTAEAEADFESYIALGGTKPVAKLIPAQDHMKNGDYAGALKLYGEALGMDGADRKTIYSYMALCAYHADDYEATVENVKAYFEAESTEETVSEIGVALKSVEERELNKMAGAACLQLQMYEPALEYLDRYLAAGNEDTSADSELRETVDAIRLELSKQQ